MRAYRALAEGTCVVVGETTPVETVSIPGSAPALAFQGADHALTLQGDPYAQYDESGTAIRPPSAGTSSSSMAPLALC